MSIESILSQIIQNQTEILNKLNNIEKKLLKDNNTSLTIELKHEVLKIDNIDISKALKYRDYRSIIYIFKLYYKNKIAESGIVYPIKIIGKRSYEYFLNNKWNPDLYGYYSMNTICLNIQNLFIKYNILDSPDAISIEDFMLNQDFIYKLSDEKHKKDIFKSIVEEVRINNI